MNPNFIAPCGIDCVNCELFENNNPEVVNRIAAAYKKTVEETRCAGCREQGGCSFHADCKTLDCVKTKQVSYCFECEDFPCTFLMPASDRAAQLPHNLKVYNLCRIQKAGEENFLKETLSNRKKYFQGKMVLGAGPHFS